MEYKIKRKLFLVFSIKVLIVVVFLNSWKEVKFINNYYIDVEIFCFCYELWSGYNIYLFIFLCYCFCLCMGCFREIIYKMKVVYMCNVFLWDYKGLRFVIGIFKEGRYIIKYILN